MRRPAPQGRGSARTAETAEPYPGLVTDTQDPLLEQEEGADRSERGPEPGREHLAVTVALAVGALASLVGVLVSLHSLAGMSDGLDDTGVVILANSLFSPIIVAAFAGAAWGLAAARLPGPRLVLALTGIGAAGLLGGGAAYLAFSVDSGIALALALILFGSALLGGALSLPRRRLPVAAGVSATFVLLLLMFARGFIDASQVSLWSDPVDQYGALGTAAPFAAGLLCGFCAYAFLRRTRAGAGLPGHLFAGALPGAIWLLSTIIAQVGVEVVLAIGVDRVSSLDSAFLTLSFQWQYNGSMTVLFGGAVCAVLAYGLLTPKTSTSS